MITGVRRSGKSSILQLFKEYLLEQNTNEENIIEINYEKFMFEELKDGKKLHKYIMDKIKDDSKVYILIDEVQEVEDWAKVINSLRVCLKADIYVTGSNSRMFLGEHLTYLSGRYVELKVYPLSFKEFLFFKSYKKLNIEEAFNEYLRIGSFPAVSLTKNVELIEAITAGLFDSIFSRDIILRGRIKDEGTFFKVAKFVIENIVFLELLRRGYEVTVGKNLSYEVDFIAVKNTEPVYFQVSLTALEESTLNREMQSLSKINDQYPKFLVTMDKIDLSNNGIKHLNLFDFLLDEENE